MSYVIIHIVFICFYDPVVIIQVNHVVFPELYIHPPVGECRPCFPSEHGFGPFRLAIFEDEGKKSHEHDIFHWNPWHSHSVYIVYIYIPIIFPLYSHYISLKPIYVCVYIYVASNDMFFIYQARHCFPQFGHVPCRLARRKFRGWLYRYGAWGHPLSNVVSENGAVPYPIILG